MASLRNQLRPKHQVLILKCYPKFQKNVPEVKPNSSELSYLLYYASTRRSKIQKVGAFLEKKTEADVRRSKIGNVQVTLAILTALIDRTRRDLTLYAPYVLRILKTVLASGHLSLVEDSIATFQAFCEHQDVATFGADQSLLRLYEDVVKTYASFATKSKSQKPALSQPTQIRWRTGGLTAIGSIARSEAIGVDGGTQLAIIIPVILENLHAESEDHVLRLFAALEQDEKSGDLDPLKGRPSIATQRTNETTQTTDGTTEDADRIAEEEVGKLALQSLKQIFSTNNRGQIRLATQAMLKFVATVVKPVSKERRPDTARTSMTTASTLLGNWSTAIIQMVSRWTPVQDRFVIMVTMMEELVKSPIAEENLAQQLVLVILVDSLLCSSINMIGLSVMDVLLGLIQHTLLLLQLGGRGSNILPHHQQTDAIDLFGDMERTSSKEVIEPVAIITETPKDEKHPSTTRQRLLDRLRMCMSALANHIYYSDQITDMIAALLLRLKPSPLSSISSPVAAVENPEAAAQAISDSVKMQEDPKTDSFFSFGTARVTALNAIKDILVVANSKASVTGAGAVGRNRVPVQTWEGTQWLLRDEDKRVRRAYVDALTVWLKFEMSKNDLSVMEDREARKIHVEPKIGNGPARAVSSASRRSKTTKAPRSTFLQLLHLAVYDNAVETPEDEAEILLLHLLLFHLIDKLGVNSVQHGLPMMIRLQEDINHSEYITTAKAKIVVGSLVHGYFWALLDRFEFENSLVGHEITSEILRRRKAHLWLMAIAIPPVTIDKIMVAGSANAIKYVDRDSVQNEALRPFDSLQDLVNQIAVAYDNSIASPPSSPPASPGKTFNTPILATITSTSRARELPEPIRDMMLSKWTKTGCLASIENSLARATSLHGSQRGTLRSLKNGYLHAEQNAVARDSSPGSDGQLPSPKSRHSVRRGLTGSKPAASRASIPTAETRARSPGASESQVGGDSRNSVVRFGELKRMLDSDASSSLRKDSIEATPSAERKHPNRASASVSVGSESLMEADGLSESEDEGVNTTTSASVASPVSATNAPPRTNPTVVIRPRTASQTKSISSPTSPTSARNRTRTNSTTSAEDPEANARALKGEIVPTVVRDDEEEDPDAVPPVPPLPEGLIGRINSPKPTMIESGAGPSMMGNPGAVLASTPQAARNGSVKKPSADDKRRSNAQRILSGIDVGTESDEMLGLGTGRPPY